MAIEDVPAFIGYAICLAILIWFPIALIKEAIDNSPRAKARRRTHRQSWTTPWIDYYGEHHQLERAKYAQEIRLHGGECMERICVMPSRRIAPGAFFHLAHDHQAGGFDRYLGPAHPECNMAEALSRGVSWDGMDDSGVTPEMLAMVEASSDLEASPPTGSNPLVDGELGPAKSKAKKGKKNKNKASFYDPETAQWKSIKREAKARGIGRIDDAWPAETWSNANRSYKVHPPRFIVECYYHQQPWESRAKTASEAREEQCKECGWATESVSVTWLVPPAIWARVALPLPRSLEPPLEEEPTQEDLDFAFPDLSEVPQRYREDEIPRWEDDPWRDAIVLSEDDVICTYPTSTEEEEPPVK